MKLSDTKVIFILSGEEIAPRFDLATEVVIVTLDSDGNTVTQSNVVLPQASADQLCHLILTEKIDTVVCGALEDEYYKYLKWKRINVIDSVIGPFDLILERLREKSLSTGDILTNQCKR